ncbi:hypothetical protein BofuT4_uP013890.1 [Botrytis cinerea T4]|uniref:Uncharacterized protein n=1 Tax=Botryotinia fuckeliana (strain T4) TaxID=999810 RepID=G2XN05_BOTF4|nr:hypothetical protein BofuT4_uP013890.1 [Botrytis cinerea T4]
MKHTKQDIHSRAEQERGGGGGGGEEATHEVLSSLPKRNPPPWQNAILHYPVTAIPKSQRRFMPNDLLATCGLLD